jgi:hypothetical protein
MSLQGPGGEGPRSGSPTLARRRKRSTSRFERSTAHLAERIHAEEAAERGEAPKPAPLRKFWG